MSGATGAQRRRPAQPPAQPPQAMAQPPAPQPSVLPPLTVWLVLAVGLAAMLLGLAMHNGKFVRVKAQVGCSTSWVNLDRPNYVVCCQSRAKGTDPAADLGGICAVVGSSMNNLLVSLSGAWLVPLVPWAWTFMGQVRKYVPCPSAGSLPSAHRLVFFLTLFLFRTFVLYVCLSAFEDAWQGPEDDRCAYANLRRNGKCAENFDLADHVVMIVTHIMVVQALEVAVMRLQPPGVWYSVGCAGAVTLVLVAARAVWETSTYFHTPLENVLGFALAAGNALVWHAGVVKLTGRAFAP